MTATGRLCTTPCGRAGGRRRRLDARNTPRLGASLTSAPTGARNRRWEPAAATIALAAADPAALNTGDTAWLLAASALVLLMAPGLALFYGGMVRSKSVLNMIMMIFGALAVDHVTWVLVGYSLAFGDDLGARSAGRPDAVRRPSAS